LVADTPALALANAAFSVIKEAVANSGDIMAAGDSLFKYFDSKAETEANVLAQIEAQKNPVSATGTPWSQA